MSNVISKIVKLLGIGTLHEPLLNGSIPLGKHTIIFGENGRGKSTFVAVLRSLADGTGDALRGRSTIDGKHQPSVQLLLGNKTHSFVEGSWDFSHDKISIFDAAFVTENVYAGSTVDTNQRKNLLNFVLGASGVKLAHKIDELTSVIAEDTKSEKLAAANLQKHIVGAMSLDGFASLNDPGKDIELDLAAARLVLQAQTEASTLKNLQSLTPLSFEGIDQAVLQEVLKLSLSSVSAGAASRLKSHRDSFGVTEEWLIEGFEHCTDGTCPFCAQRLIDSRIIPAYEACFSEAYAEHRLALGRAIITLEASVSAEIEATMRRVIELNASRITGWRQFIPDIKLSFDIQRATEIFSNARTTLEAISAKKISDPTVERTLDQNESQDISLIGDLVVRVDDYNSTVVRWDSKIEEIKKSAESPDLAAAQARLDNILCRIARATASAREAVADWQREKSAKTAHEEDKASARAALDKYCAAIPTWLISSVNRHLKNCGTYFELTSLRHVYAGATPRLEYAIALRGRPVDLTGKLVDDITFGTALSQGDKSALAFAFFVARLENDATLLEQTIVFDDPLSSLDSCRRRYTRQKIADLAATAKQLILLTHEESTVSDVYQLITGNECCLLQFKEKADFTVIVRTSVKELMATEYVKYFDRMQHILHGEGTPESVVKDIRPYLELNLRYRFPEYFRPEPLGTMIRQIRLADTTSILHRMQSQLGVLEEINDYCTEHSHGDGALENVEKILATDVKSKIIRTLEFARGFPSDLSPQ